MNFDLNELLIHPKTYRTVINFIKSPSHSLLIIGETGSGKRTLANSIAGKILDISPNALESYPYFIRLRRVGAEKEIPIDAVRSLISHLRLKTTGEKEIRRVILIEDAGFMTTEAQNSILKVLEEPSLDTVFIMTAISERNVLPTISSRAQLITVHPVGLEEAIEYFSTDSPHDLVDKAWRLSGGNVGLLSALLNDSEVHPLKSAVDIAKSLILQSPYERLISLESYTKDKTQLLLLLEALGRIITSLHHNAVRNNNKPLQGRLLRSRVLLNQMKANMAVNANPKLAVMHLAMNLTV